MPPSAPHRHSPESATPKDSEKILPASSSDYPSGNTWEVEVFFDGDCPLCLREINWLKRRDRAGRIRFTDISAAGFEAMQYGKTQEELMARIHGRLPKGDFIEGVEVFRRLYSAVGLAWLVAPTRLPGVRILLDWCYRIFAKNRLRLTGRCSTESCPR